MNQTGGSKIDVTVKLLSVFLLTLLSFSVGTFVGKQVSDSDYRRAALEEEFGTAERATASVNPESNMAGDVTEQDVESLTQEFVNAAQEEANAEANPGEEKLPNPVDEVKAQADAGEIKEPSGDPVADAEKAMEAAKAAPEIKNSQPETQREVASAANRVSRGMAPTKTPVKVRRPNSVLPSVATNSIGRYTVQVASYSTEKEATQRAQKLKDRGYTAFYSQAEVKGQTWYRVSVGLFPTQKSAMAFRKELKRNAGIRSSIVRKVVK